MGFLRKLFQGGAGTDGAQAARAAHPEPRPDAEVALDAPPLRLKVTQSFGVEQDVVQLTGTTTFAREAIASLALRYGIADGGYLEVEGVLQREVDNRADPNAVAVHAEGERIGYLPGYLASGQDLSPSGARPIKVQIFTEVLAKGLRAEAWAWLGEGRPHWIWSATKRPPMSSQAKAQAHHGHTSQMVSDALAGGGGRANQFRAGIVNGIHYLQLIEPIKQLKRDGNLEEALELCYAAIAGAEGDRNGREPAPWYTEQAAIIHRKLGQRDKEIAVLERWLILCPANRRVDSGIAERLVKLTK